MLCCYSITYMMKFRMYYITSFLKIREDRRNLRDTITCYAIEGKLSCTTVPSSFLEDTTSVPL